MNKGEQNEQNNDEILNWYLKRLAEKPAIQPSEIFRSFNVDKWKDWLDDIINFGFANPISTISVDGDTIIEIADYLRFNRIPLNNYEEAVSEYLDQIYSSQINHEVSERLLNALINIQGSFSDDLLLKIVVSQENFNVKGKLSYIKTLALLALAKSSKLKGENAEEVYNWIIMAGLKEMTHDPAFFGNALRFSYSHIGIKGFFDLLGYSFVILNNDKNVIENANNLLNRHVAVLIDKIEELHFQGLGRFYSEFFLWLTNVFDNIAWANNKVLECAMSSFVPLLSEYPFADEINKIQQPFTSSVHNDRTFNQYEYALAVKVISTIYSGSLKEKLMSYDILRCLTFLVSAQPEYSIFLSNFLGKNGFFLRKNYEILPHITYSELGNEVEFEVIETVTSILSDAMYSSININRDQQFSLQKDIITFFHDLVIREQDVINEIYSL